MLVRVFSLCIILLLGTGCQTYTIKATSSTNIELLSRMNYKIASIKEAIGDPYENVNNIKQDEKEFVEMSDADKTVVAQTFFTEIKKLFWFGNNTDIKNNNDSVIVDIRINNRVACNRYGRNMYIQNGEILVGIQGSTQDGKNLFSVNVNYDMGGSASSNIKSLVCYTQSKIFKIINKEILPLAIREIGQNRLIEK